MGMVGFDGIVGVSVLLGGKIANNDAIVHLGGAAYRLKTEAARTLLKEHDEFQAALLAYIRKMIREISQIAACNSLHMIEQRLARWLLLTAQRANKADIDVTHDLIAQLLSVRRATISDALNRLASTGLVCNGRTNIHIADRCGLEDVSCECYRAIKRLHWSD
jgi:CRP-like cAMP-binding protein